MNIVIYLIEDNVADQEDTLTKLNDFVQKNKYPDHNYSFQFKLLEGTVPGDCYKQNWMYYEPNVIDVIRQKIIEEERNGNRMGLLLDVLLTKEEYEYSRSKYYPKAGIASDIYFEFYKVLPIYIITSILNFGTQSDIIMGVELRDRYLLKGWLNYPEDICIKNMLNQYIEMMGQMERTEKKAV